MNHNYVVHISKLLIAVDAWNISLSVGRYFLRPNRSCYAVATASEAAQPAAAV